MTRPVSSKSKKAPVELPAEMEKELQQSIRRHPANGAVLKAAERDAEEEAGPKEWRPKTGQEQYDQAMAMPAITPMERARKDAALKFAGETLTEESKGTGNSEAAEDIVRKLTHIRANMMGSRAIGMFNAAKPEDDVERNPGQSRSESPK